MTNSKSRPDAEKPASPASPDEQPQRPIDRPPGDGDPPPDPGVRISSISPIAGALAGGITVTLTGTGFQPGAEVFFGSSPSPTVTFQSSNKVSAVLPPATETGSVDVSLVNPDNTSATRAGGFTYVVTGTGAQAEVSGISPLAVIEDTETEVTIRGRNLIEAHTNGMFALRGLSRVNIISSLSTSGLDEATGIESLTFTVRITATPPLEQHERMAIQVLASRRPGSQTDGIPESSRKMFTVLPRAVPVPIAVTEQLEAGKPNLVVVAGRNLQGCTLSVGEGATLHIQRSDEQTLVGLVTVSDSLVSDSLKSSASAQLTIHSDSGGEVAQFAMPVAPGGHSDTESAPTAAMSAQPEEGATSAAAEPGAGDIALTLTPIPGQQMLGPTAEDSTIFRLGGESLPNFFFDFGDFEVVIFERTFVISLFNEVRLIPFFDNGVGDAISNTPILAQVGKLFRLRGVGLLVALRVELSIHIEIVLIIGFRFNIWPFGLFNEFYNDYPYGIGSIVITIRLFILVQINFLISFLVALVRPGGELRVLFFFNLTIEIDFRISSDGRTLHFDPDFDIDVDYTRIGPLRNLLRLCGGRFQLADDNGQTDFTSASGDHQSFYFVHTAGECCVPWEFDMRLVRFRPGTGIRETVQEGFRADYCLNAAPSANQLKVIVVSNRTPKGYPPPLELDVLETASLKALAEIVHVDGNRVPSTELRDVTELGYQVEFYLDSSSEVVDPEALRQGTAIATEAGENIIRARLFKSDVVFRDPQTGEEIPFPLWPGSILGFDILNSLARGLPPAVLAGGLPVEISALPQGAFTVVPTVAYKDEQNQWRESAEIPNLLPGEVTRELERSEPFEPQPNKPQREYALAVKLPDVPDNVYPLTVTIKVTNVKMEVLPAGSNTPVRLGLLEAVPQLKEIEANLQFAQSPTSRNFQARISSDFKEYFTGKLIAVNQEGTVTLNAKPTNPDELFVVTVPSNVPGQSALPLTVIPNHKEDFSTSPRKLVPPGFKVADRHVLLSISLEGRSNGPNVRRMRTLRTVVRNEENFEEYLRVFEEVRDILTAAGTDFVQWASNFYTTLTSSGLGVLTAQGAKLWKDSYTAVQSAPDSGPSPKRDDRPLYWVRLQSIAALRAYARRKGVTLTKPMIEQFEWPSRGLEWPSGSISFADAATTRINVALSSAGATATASSTLNANHIASAAINGDRKGLHWGSDPATGSGWHDATADLFPDTLEIAFAGQHRITEINVFSVQDNINAPAEPTETMTFTLYGLQDFDVEFWTGTTWQVVPGGSVTGNNRVWRKFTFPPLATTRIRVVVKKALEKHSRIVEVEAWTSLDLARKVIVTGFDPFYLAADPGKSNPSGLVALHFNRKTLSQSQGLADVRTVVFPVRYQDFDEGMVENAVRPSILSLALLMTTSRGRPGFYDVERFAGRNRGPKLYSPSDPQSGKADPLSGKPDITREENNLIDNNRTLKTQLTEPQGLEAGDQYLESTLPYTAVITSVDTTRVLPGPQSGPNFSNTDAFVLNQAYWVLDEPPAFAQGKRRPATADASDPNGYIKFPEAAKGLGTSFEASGGNYLSNEAFYRTALQRNKLRASLKSGHLHLPWLDNPHSGGPGILEAVKRAVERFLQNPFQGLRSSGNIVFPRTVVNTTSQPRQLSAINETDQLIRIGSVQVSPGFAFVSPTGSSISIPARSSVPLSFTFTPTEARLYTGDVTVLDEAGEPLFTASLRGEGVAVSPIPIVIDFSPLSGRPGAWVTVNGENFDETFVVRIGGTSVPFALVDANVARANVTDEVFTGPIEVETPSGVAVSSTVFRVVRRFPRELLAEHLRERRLGLELTQRAAAQQMGVNPSTYSNWERGRDEPRTSSFPTIIGFLGYDPSPEAQTLPERIREARQREGISQRELAERLGIAPSTVKAWEADTVRRPTPRVTSIFEEYLKSM